MDRLMLSVVLLWAAAAGAAAAAEPRPISVTFEAQVRDAHGAQGKRETAQLAKRAAMRLCSRYSNPARIDDRENYYACVNSARVKMRTITLRQPRSGSLAGAP